MNAGFQQMFDLIFPDVIRTFCVCDRCTGMIPPRVFVRPTSERNRPVLSPNTCVLAVAATRMAIFATLRIARRFDMPVNPANMIPADMIQTINQIESLLPDALPYDECIMDHRILVVFAQLCDEHNPFPGRPPSPSHDMDAETPRDFFGERTDVATIAVLLPVMAM